MLELEYCLRIFIAFIVGALIGWERKKTKQSDSILRTHILVCIGACITTLSGLYLSQHYSFDVDPTRISAQVVSGIGFLGAGMIIKDGFSISGLTTGASLLTVSCLGIAIGIGFYFVVIVATVLIMFTLVKFADKDDSEEKKNNHIKMVAFGNPISNLFKKTSNNKEIKNSYD